GGGGTEAEAGLLALPRRAQEAQVGAAVGADGETLEGRAQDLAHHSHRLAARAPAADADRHPIAQLRDGLGQRGALVHGGGSYNETWRSVNCARCSTPSSRADGPTTSPSTTANAAAPGPSSPTAPRGSRTRSARSARGPAITWRC